MYHQERVAAAQDAVAASTTALDAARTQYEEVSDRVVREFARFRRDKASDMKKIILDYVNVQVSAILVPWRRCVLCFVGVRCRSPVSVGYTVSISTYLYRGGMVGGVLGRRRYKVQAYISCRKPSLPVTPALPTPSGDVFFF